MNVQRERVPVPILYRDPEFVVVDKPAGLLVHRGWGRDRQTALSEVRRQVGCWVHPVHRLDRATSGVLIFALNEVMCQRLSGAFMAREVRKHYLALVRGKPEASFVVDSPVHRGERRAGEAVERVPALTRFVRLGVSEVDRCSLVRAEPVTGRLHQIRRHLKHASHPIIGDVRYGKGPINRHYRATYALHRMALHAARVCFLHPMSGDPITVVAPLPEELAGCFAKLGLTAGELEVPTDSC